MTKPDLLSPRADHEKGENDNSNIVFLKPEYFQTCEVIFETLDNDFVRRIKRVRNNQDRAVAQALTNKDKLWIMHDDGLITWQDRIYVPKDSKLREDIICSHHNSTLAGHPGRYKTQELITRNYWWPGIQRDVRRYVDGCDTCQ